MSGTRSDSRRHQARVSSRRGPGDDAPLTLVTQLRPMGAIGAAPLALQIGFQVALERPFFDDEAVLMRTDVAGVLQDGQRPADRLT